MRESNDGWPMFRHDPARTGCSSDGGPESLCERWRYETDSPIISSPAIGDGSLFVANEAGHVFALSTESGSLVWDEEMSAPIGASPAVADGHVFVGSDDGHLYALDVDTGDVTWEYETGDAISSSPAIVADTIFVGSDDGHLYAINFEGEQQWRYRTKGPVVSSPVVEDETVYVGSDDGHLHAVDADEGTSKWRSETSGPIVSSPAISGDNIYVGSNNGKIYSFDLNGQERWRHDTAGAVTSTPAVRGECIYIGTLYIGEHYDRLHGQVLALEDEQTRARIKWNYEVNDFVDTSPAVSKDHLYIGSDTGEFFVFARNDGTLVDSFDDCGPTVSSPVVIGENVYVCDKQGDIYGLSE